MLKIFLNHTAEDKALVMPYFEKLKALGYEPWIDNRILPGHDWDEEIQRAFNAADVYLLFMSPRSVKKRGYVQREINDALDKQRYLLPGDIGLIPLMLEECEVPEKISRTYQYIRLPEGWGRVVEALALAAKQREIAVISGLEMGPFRLFVREEARKWNGYPGYDLSVRIPHIESALRPNAALELNTYFESMRLNLMMAAREVQLTQDIERYKDWGVGEDPIEPVSYFARYVDPILLGGEIASFSSNESSFHCGAAHSYSYVETHNFLIKEDGLIRLGLWDFFIEPRKALEPFVHLVRQKIVEEWHLRYEGEMDEYWSRELETAFPMKFDTYNDFAITPTGITLIFPPYTLGGFAAGSWMVDISYEELVPWLRPGGPHELAKRAMPAGWNAREQV